MLYILISYKDLSNYFRLQLIATGQTKKRQQPKANASFSASPKKTKQNIKHSEIRRPCIFSFSNCFEQRQKENQDLMSGKLGFNVLALFLVSPTFIIMVISPCHLNEFDFLIIKDWSENTFIPGPSVSHVPDQRLRSQANSRLSKEQACLHFTKSEN